jgi:hypothetical protein
VFTAELFFALRRRKILLSGYAAEKYFATAKKAWFF